VGLRESPSRPWTSKRTQIARTRARETLQFASCTTALKPTRVAPPTWWPWRSTSARGAERSVGARCPGGRTRCPPASAAGVARSCGYGTGRGTQTGGATSATSALESDLVPRRCSVAADRSFGRFCSAFRIAACHFPGAYGCLFSVDKRFELGLDDASQATGNSDSSDVRDFQLAGPYTAYVLSYLGAVIGSDQVNVVDLRDATRLRPSSPQPTIVRSLVGVRGSAPRHLSRSMRFWTIPLHCWPHGVLRGGQVSDLDPHTHAPAQLRPVAPALRASAHTESAAASGQ
jgi:hypothetical protein